jgi:predicted nuclease of predicted toxin-antitoxin system
MGLALYMDVHLPKPITVQLRLRGVEVMTVQEDGRETAEDHLILERAHVLGRVVVTQDIRFKALAEKWRGQGQPFSGLIFAYQLRSTIGQLVRDLELICKATELAEWQNQVLQLPL